jgi:hypothetical protein
MAFVASDVTYTINSRRLEGVAGERSVIIATLTFGAGSEQYTQAAGVPLSLSKLGLYRQIESLTVLDSGASAYWWSWKRSDNSLHAFVAANDVSGGVRTEVTDGTNPVTQTLVVKVVGW